MDDRIGRCYELAFNRVAQAMLAKETDGVHLVHGVIRDTNLSRAGAVICHAWVEIRGLIWEPVLDRLFPTDVFMHMFDAEVVHRYAAHEACMLTMTHEHSGPWEKVPDDEQRTSSRLKGRRMKQARDDAEALSALLMQENPEYLCMVLPDNTIACTQDLLFTRAIILGVTRLSYSKRFCFEDRGLAMQRFLELQSENDEPQGYVARRPQLP